MNKATPQQLWQGFHWLFFVDIQGMMISLLRFEMELAAKNIAQAKIELETAAKLMLASGAAMELAGSFSKKEFEDQVRSTMTPPHVQSDNFSGLMFWDHAYLMTVWKRLKPVFMTLPDELQPTHKEFVAAYCSLAKSHKAVCQKFVGTESGSLRSPSSISALEILEKFENSRLQQIDPKKHSINRCPFHNNTSQE